LTSWDQDPGSRSAKICRSTDPDPRKNIFPFFSTQIQDSDPDLHQIKWILSTGFYNNKKDFSIKVYKDNDAIYRIVQNINFFGLN